ncbi:MAG: hypothetical protein PHW76_07080 [Alphaproteobacteria bacterium]|nr:hypothetical protein [Alphaproteobacteria bacterium]
MSALETAMLVTIFLFAALGWGIAVALYLQFRSTRANVGQDSQIRQRRLEKIGTALSGYSKFTSVLKLNMETIVEDTKNAAITVLGNLSSIRSLFSEVTDFVYQNGEAARTSSAQARALVLENKDLIVGLKALWSKRDMELAEYRKWLSSLIEGAKNFQNKLSEIETLSQKIKLMTSTAADDTSITGPAAFKLDFLAKETSALSTQMERVIGFIRSGVQNMEKNIVLKGARERIISSNEGQSRRYESEMFDVLGRKIGQLNEACSKITQHHQMLTEKIDEMGSNIAAKILQSYAEIQFQDRVSQQIEMLLKALAKSNVVFEQCAGALSPDARTEPSTTMELVIDSLEEDYVMESQHKHHAKALNQSYEDKIIEKVELF